MLTVMPLVCTKHLGKSSGLAMRSSGLGAALFGEIPAISPAGSAGEWLGRLKGLRGPDLGAHLRWKQRRWAGTAEAGDGGRWRFCSGEPGVRPG
jgi:hypothetical protein